MITFNEQKFQTEWLEVQNSVNSIQGKLDDLANAKIVAEATGNALIIEAMTKHEQTVKSSFDKLLNRYEFLKAIKEEFLIEQ